MAAASELSPLEVRAMDEVSPVGESGHKGDGEPVTRRFTQSCLVLHVARQMGQGVALSLTALIRNRLVAPGERDRLEREEGDFLRIVEREFNHPSNLLIVYTIDNCDDRHDVDAGVVKVLDRLELHVE